MNLNKKSSRTGFSEGDDGNTIKKSTAREERFKRTKSKENSVSSKFDNPNRPISRLRLKKDADHIR